MAGKPPVIQLVRLVGVVMAVATSVQTMPSFVDVGIDGIDPSWDDRGVNTIRYKLSSPP